MMRSILKIIYLSTRRSFFSMLHFLFLRHKTVFKPDVLNKILFIRIDRIGDLVLSTPALRAIKDKYPQSELTVLASPSNAPVIYNNPHVDRVLVFNSAGEWKEWIKTIRRLRIGAYDLAIDPYQNYASKTAVVSFLSGARFRIGYESYGRGIFYNIAILPRKDPLHQVDIALDALKPIGINNADRSPEMFLSEEEKRMGLDWIRENCPGRKRIIGVHPGAFYSTQRWPAEYFSELIQEVQKRGEYDVILFGGPGDAFIIDEIRSCLDQKPALHLGNDLRWFAAILFHCNMLICNNSGPLHIAAALGIPTLSFMGPTVKETWSPIGPKHKIMRMDNLPCIGCNSGICFIKTHDCMRLLSPSMVMNEIIKQGENTSGNTAGRGMKS